MKRVISNKEVHIRIREPWRKSNNLKGILHPGFELEVEEIEGEGIDNNNVWYKDKNGDFYWSGGFGYAAELQIFFNYRQRIKLNGPTPSGEGESIRVAVLDTGIYAEHPDFDKKRIHFTNYLNLAEQMPHDNIGHGTHVAGLIGACTADDVGICGVAPKTSLEIYKVIKDNHVPRGDKIKEVFDDLENKPPHIINLSLSISQAEYEDLEDSIARLFNAGSVLVAAAGNDDFLTSSLLRPALSDKIISVGAISNSLLPTIKFNGLHPRLNFFFRNDPISSTFTKPTFYKSMAECSMYTGVVSGLLSSFLSSDQSIPAGSRFQSCLEFLTHHSFPHKNVNELQPLTLYDAQR